MGNKADMLGKGQKRVFDRLVNGDNIFITGNAGTGKSFLVEAFDEYCTDSKKVMLKTAPTGIAACNIKGVTLHSQFKLKTDVKSMLREEKEIPLSVKSVLNIADIILIDEISMVRIDVFDKIMRYIELENISREEQKRKPLQLIFVGDFYQLAPVIPPNDKNELDMLYGKDIGNGFAFQSKYWKSLNMQFELLTEVFRQGEDTAFCSALDQCKEGDTSCLSYFAFNTDKQENPKAVWVCGKNVTAKDKNAEKLNKLTGQKYFFKAEYSGNVTENDKLCEDELVFKEQARVIFLVNDPSGLYQNGTMGTITCIGSDVINVKIDGRDVVVGVKKAKFSKSEYVPMNTIETYKDEKGEEKIREVPTMVLTETGSATQFPLKLGYAVTVHKAQGQTYEAMNFMPEIFQDGQLYVALSRCKTADKIYIASPLKPSMVRTSQEVVNFYKNPENYTFFGREKDLVSVSVARECEGAVKLLNKVFPSYKFEILNFLEAYEKKMTEEQSQESSKLSIA